MKIHIEITDGLPEDEIIIRCGRVDETIQKIQQFVQSLSNSKIAFYKKNQEFYFPLDNVLFFETEEERIYAHTTNDAYLIKYCLYELDEILPQHFVRVAKSTIVNIMQVYSVTHSRTTSTLINFIDSHKHVYASRSYYKELRKRLDEGEIMKNRNWFWGSFFLLSAIFVVSSQIWFSDKVGVISILATVFLIAYIIYSLPKLEYFGILVPLSILYVMYCKPFKLIYISPWLLISAAVLLSISFYCIFRRRPKKTTSVRYNKNHGTDKIDDDNPYAKVVLSSASKYLHSDCLQSGEFIAKLGMLEVYFDQVQLSKDGAEILINCNTSTINLYIPKDWLVIDNLQLYLSDVRYDNDQTTPSEGQPQLTLCGKVYIGDVHIVYI